MIRIHNISRHAVTLFALFAFPLSIWAREADDVVREASSVTTEIKRDVDQVIFFSNVHDSNAKAAKLLVVTANGDEIPVKADSEDHALPYTVNQIECKVQKGGAFNAIVPHNRSYTRYCLDFYYAGNEKQPHTAIFTDTESDKGLLIINVADQNSFITAHYGQNEVQRHMKRSDITVRHIRFNKLGKLHIKKVAGEAAARMIAAKRAQRRD